ncbi:hypothetical protein [Halopenitus persicus]|uniref:hypothetical protein n=1 Tax=Halopenitus persicus TaxID=1048396 RepID=UPI000BBA5A86|nr:hypothetical protein [Halopenitus persicus]
MSHQNVLRRWLSIDRLDLTVARIGVVASVLLLGLRLLTAQVLLVVIPTATGLACALYLGVQSRRSPAFAYPTLPRIVIGYLPAAVFVGLAALVALVFVTGERTGPIYLLTGAIGTAILAQTLLIADDELAPALVLAQIIIAGVVIRLTVLFVTPGLIGVDAWTHVPSYVAGIAETGSLSAISDSKYVMAPLYHAIGAIGALVFGSARTGVYLSVGLLVPLSALFVYAAGKLLVPVRWALLATALYVFADQFIRWGIHVIPTSLGLVFFLGALYCVTASFYTDDLWVVGLLPVFSLAIVFTHQVSTAIVLVLLGIASASVLVVRLLGGGTQGSSVRTVVGIVGTFLLTLVTTVVSWMHTPWYADDPFLWEMVDTLEGTMTEEAGFLNLVGGSGAGGGAAGESVGLFAELLPFIEWFGFGLLLSAAIVGGLAMLRMRNPPDVTVTYLVSAATMFVIVFGFSLFGIRDLLPGRWIAFMYAPFVVIAAVGLYHLSENGSRRVILAVFVIVALSYPATMIVAEKATLDSPAFENENPRISYTESEIAAVETISTVYAPETDRRVYSDHPYQSLFGRLGGYSSRVVVVDEGGVTTSDPVIVREYQTSGPVTFYEAGDPPRQISSRTVAPDRVCTPGRNHVYANDEVRMCTSPAAELEVGA